MSFRTAPQAIWDIYMLSAAGLTVWRGGWAERTAAFGMIVDSVASALLQNTHDWAAPQWGDFAVDVVFLIVLLGVALKSRRYWPLFAAAFQLISVVIYGARLADPRVGALAPYRAVVIWSYLLVAAVIVGTFLRRRTTPVATRLR